MLPHRSIRATRGFMGVSFLTSKSKTIVLSPHFWIIVVLFTLTSISHYHELLQNVPIIGQISTIIFFGLGRHTGERLIYLIIIAYSTLVFGGKIGGTVLLASILAMLPRAIFISPTPKDALSESLIAAFIGVLLVLVIEAWRRIREERGKLQVAMASLRLSEGKYRELFQNASDAIWVHDLEGNITAANKASEKLTGYTVDELLGKNVTEFLSENGYTLASMVKGKLLEGEPIEPRYEQRLFRRDRTEAIVELTTNLIMQDDHPIAFHNIARDVTQERKMRDSMHFYLQKVLVAQEEERKRIARELHDDAGQSLLLLAHQLDAIASDPRSKLSKSVQEKLTHVHDLAVETHNGLRRYAQELRPAILDDMGLVAAMEWMVDSLIAEKGIDVDVQLDMPGHDLPRETQLLLFRIVQEALGNIRRHAQASKVMVRLESGAGKIRLIITDNGKGFEVPVRISDLSSIGKLGLIGMQERVRLLGGVLEVKSEPGKGTSVIVEAPI
jgi:two-component system sensor histidine kinase DegS